MDAASIGVFSMLSTMPDTAPVEEVFMKFVRQLEEAYKPTVNIALFIFAVRAFFCWHRAPELCGETEAINGIRAAWLKQNTELYNEWLRSTNDDHGELKWEKWTFQAKNTILNEFLASNVCPPAPSIIGLGH